MSIREGLRARYKNSVDFVKRKKAKLALTSFIGAGLLFGGVDLASAESGAPDEDKNIALVDQESIQSDVEEINSILNKLESQQGLGITDVITLVRYLHSADGNGEIRALNKDFHELIIEYIPGKFELESELIENDKVEVYIQACTNYYLSEIQSNINFGSNMFDKFDEAILNDPEGITELTVDQQIGIDGSKYFGEVIKIAYLQTDDTYYIGKPYSLYWKNPNFVGCDEDPDIVFPARADGEEGDNYSDDIEGDVELDPEVWGDWVSPEMKHGRLLVIGIGGAVLFAGGFFVAKKGRKEGAVAAGD